MKLSDFMGEATEYDKKEMLEERKPKSWLKSVSAFANGIGGALIFGVSDNEVLVGLDDAKRVSEKISEAIKIKMDPVPKIILEIYTEDEKEFIILKVSAGQETPLEVYSPGGMIDGSIVQNLDIDHVASKRRNPVIADIFSRMHFMERRGSGFKKIKGDYRHAVNYSEELEPKFVSTPASFFVTLYNLNYNVPIEKVTFEPEKVAFDVEKVAFERYLSKAAVNTPTKEKARALFGRYRYEAVFSRADIVKMFAVASSSAGKFINRLKELGLVEAVEGQGKGKYKFVKSKE